MPAKTLLMIWTLGTAVLLSGCFDESNDTSSFGSGGGPGGGGGSGDSGGPGDGGEQNQAPTIAGTPSANILEGELYEFRPTASDPEGDALEFSISRKPAWAQFDKASGRLSGTPRAEDVGNFTNIAISVSDGKATATLAFDVSVNQIAAGNATLSWSPPTANADGSPLTDLTGYRIYYGRNQDNLTQVVVVNNPGLTRYVVENLTPARWHFEMTSVNSEGAESQRSPTATKTIG